MKCGRCAKELGAANIHNAYYITNAADQKTFGAIEVEEYAVIDENGVEILRGPSFSEATSNLKIKVDELDETKVTKEIAKNHSTDAQEITTLIEEIDNLIRAKNKVKIIKEVKVKLVPKSLIICKDCKEDDDTVIWG